MVFRYYARSVVIQRSIKCLSKDSRDVFATMLEKTDIIVDIRLRLDVCKVTRRDMREQEIRYIVELITMIHKHINESNIEDEIKKVRAEVNQFMLHYQSLHYSLDNVIAVLTEVVMVYSLLSLHTLLSLPQ